MLAVAMRALNESVFHRYEYVLAENKILRKQIRGALKMTDGDRRTLAELGKKLGKKVLAEVGSTVRPETVLGWYSKLVAKKWHTSKRKKSRGRPPVGKEIEKLVLKFSQENPSWGYGRIVGALGNIGHKVAAQTVGNILKKHGIEPVPSKNQGMKWSEFIKSHLAVMAATDFFTAEVMTLKGLVTYYVLFFIEIGSRRVHLAGITPNPDEAWMTVKLPARSPNLNVFAERWVKSVKDECLSKLLLLGEGSLRRAVEEFLRHYHGERNHQGRENALLQPRSEDRVGAKEGRVRRRGMLGGATLHCHRDQRPRGF